MERIMEPKSDLFTLIKNNYTIVRNRPSIKPFPQMPVLQIQLFIKQAARKQRNVVIQLNPSLHNKQTTEVSGRISLSHRSSHIILTAEGQQTVYLVQPTHIRHLRLA